MEEKAKEARVKTLELQDRLNEAMLGQKQVGQALDEAIKEGAKRQKLLEEEM